MHGFFYARKIHSLIYLSLSTQLHFECFRINVNKQKVFTLKSLKLTMLLLGALSLSACSSFYGDKTDIYGQNADGDGTNGKEIVFNKRVSHIVTFEFNSSVLPYNAADVIEPHVRYLRSKPTTKLALQGNASQEGSRAFNYNLAKERSESVKGLFIDLGVAEERIVMLSVGETNAGFIPQRSVLIVY